MLSVPFFLSSATDKAVIALPFALFGAAYFPLKWIDSRRRAASAILSATSESVNLYEGIVDGVVLSSSSYNELLKAGLVVDAETSQRIERLESSGEVITLNGNRLNPPLYTDEADVASPEPNRPDIPFQVPEIALHYGDSPRRQLSPAELEELRKLCPDCKDFRLLGGGVAVGVYGIGLVIVNLGKLLGGMKAGPWVTGFLILLAVGWLALKIRNAWTVYTQYRNFQRDLENGIVLQIEDEGAILEILPILGTIWTREGEPEDWRRLMPTKAAGSR